MEQLINLFTSLCTNIVWQMQFCHKCSNYIATETTHKKTEIINACNKDKTHGMSNYFKLARTSHTRDIPRLGIDANKLENKHPNH